MVELERMLTRCFSTSAAYVGHSSRATNGIKKGSLSDPQCPVSTR